MFSSSIVGRSRYRRDWKDGARWEGVKWSDGRIEKEKGVGTEAMYWKEGAGWEKGKYKGKAEREREQDGKGEKITRGEQEKGKWAGRNRRDEWEEWDGKGGRR
jgi:hypothetical protein